MKGMVVLKNTLDGLFVLPEHNLHWFDKNTNIPVTRTDILSELNKAQFLELNSFVERAETENFYFFRYEEDRDDEIIWVQEK